LGPLPLQCGLWKWQNLASWNETSEYYSKHCPDFLHCIVLNAKSLQNLTLWFKWLLGQPPKNNCLLSMAKLWLFSKVINNFYKPKWFRKCINGSQLPNYKHLKNLNAKLQDPTKCTKTRSITSKIEICVTTTSLIVKGMRIGIYFHQHPHLDLNYH